MFKIGLQGFSLQAFFLWGWEMWKEVSLGMGISGSGGFWKSFKGNPYFSKEM
ncbi:hypothetical protein SAMN04487911_14612 [Arenibacter nanhaiticus]|uniref:Uncharacterized protein n=1 Tax=Arenibacter nanhaiticus TaxID=558155 RepID=A0A1M6MRH9_9FLAO|nr:hypothetical protein SAMN04487911_14612 [Arenibacter nanhaiticus]